ncbi:VRR-NUC domain-containing protein [Undibacterium terreum]|uniref:phosphodiesterase I n=1 Tax=Undibacterium terreum TaxID=1224302 RepID=A0A916XBZ2_9BURK|nr:VRR-NUC domain-containing protein [Undibacterium terreum]GGC62360.1 nuclease [Undibacterium terreum]
MIPTLENPYYYLDNFRMVLDWISMRYDDLLIVEEREFISRFAEMPWASQALLVRMVMRKGELFRASKLNYTEIGDTRKAATELVAAGWVDDAPLLYLEHLFVLLKKDEIAAALGLSGPVAAAKKADQLEMLQAEFADQTHSLQDWYPACDDCVYHLQIAELCNRLRLMFFGNLYQDWSEFVLADLGIYKYEKVEFSAASCGFRTRADVDTYLHLHQCRERFNLEQALPGIIADIGSALDNPWLEGRRAKLLFQIGQQYEKLQDWVAALEIYRSCNYPGARARRIRVLERLEDFTAAFELADVAQQAPESEAEKQQLARMLPRLRRKLGHSRLPVAAAIRLSNVELLLPRPQADFYVEGVVREHLAQQHADAAVHYVENTLINSLFGLLCWDAIFLPLPGAFFHPYHTGPADLHSADFYHRREAEFTLCLAQLESGQYKQAIRARFIAKAGIQSPFVFWGSLTEELLEQALACIPAAHLKKWFERLLQDIKVNRSGLPDLIQFWPQERRYQLIEVKGPGDRLQDNQIRWLDYCVANDMPVAVCYVQWAEEEVA